MTKRGKDNPSYRHGMTFTPTWFSWVNMLSRCLNKNVAAYKNYGGRGIKVCDRWLSFENFLADMGERPSGKTLDRFPKNDGDYEPGNCRWATRHQQTRNTRHNVNVTINGKTMCAADWARKAGISPVVLIYRVRAGWDEDRLLITPQRKGNPNPRNPWTGKKSF